MNMNTDPNAILTWLTYSWFAVAMGVFIALFFVAAPYGRPARSGWGPMISSRTGWFLMESPSPLVFGACFLLGEAPVTTTSLAFVAMWWGHYVYRAWIYPFRLNSAVKPMPLSVVAMAILFNCANGYLNGRYLFGPAGGYPAAWLATPQFWVGALLFVSGLMINRRADHTLWLLREPGQSEYRIPQGGLYRWVSCPNYLGEIVQWFGWAIATWSLAGLSFAVWTVANLAPRARSNHAWYRAHFPDYPRERKALIPIIW